MKINAMHLLVSYGAAAAVMFVIDMIWLGFIAKPWYQAGMGHLMAAEPNLIAAAVFYLLFPLGLMLFAVLPQAASIGLSKAALWGAAFGFFAYATYDLTNLATLKNFPISLALLDMTWGACVSGVSAAAGKAAYDYYMTAV